MNVKHSVSDPYLSSTSLSSSTFLLSHPPLNQNLAKIGAKMEKIDKTDYTIDNHVPGMGVNGKTLKTCTDLIHFLEQYAEKIRTAPGTYVFGDVMFSTHSVFFEDSVKDGLTYTEMVIRTVKDRRAKPARKKELNSEQEEDIDETFEKPAGAMIKRITKLVDQIKSGSSVQSLIDEDESQSVEDSSCEQSSQLSDDESCDDEEEDMKSTIFQTSHDKKGEVDATFSSSCPPAEIAPPIGQVTTFPIKTHSKPTTSKDAVSQPISNKILLPFRCDSDEDDSSSTHSSSPDITPSQSPAHTPPLTHLHPPHLAPAPPSIPLPLPRDRSSPNIRRENFNNYTSKKVNHPRSFSRIPSIPPQSLFPPPGLRHNTFGRDIPPPPPLHVPLHHPPSPADLFNRFTETAKEIQRVCPDYLMLATLLWSMKNLPFNCNQPSPTYFNFPPYHTHNNPAGFYRAGQASAVSTQA